MILDKRKYLRYNSLFHKPGIIDDSSTGMEWMDADYDSRTLREVTESSTVFGFLNELLTALLMGTPNCVMLAYSLGLFDWKDKILISKEIFNKSILEILMYPLNKNTVYRDELGRITIEFAQDVFYRINVLELLNFHKLKVNKEDDFEIITAPSKVKRTPLDEEVSMIIKIIMKNEILTTIDIFYE